MLLNQVVQAVSSIGRKMNFHAIPQASMEGNKCVLTDRKNIFLLLSFAFCMTMEAGMSLYNH